MKATQDTLNSAASIVGDDDYMHWDSSQRPLRADFDVKHWYFHFEFAEGQRIKIS